MALFIVLLVAAALVLVIWVALQGGRGKPSQTPPHFESAPSRQVSAAQPPRFDAAHATHLREERVLKGAAYVIDGDTIRINKTQIRLFGIDAPELNHPYGVRAKRALIRMCKEQAIRAVVTDEDRHGRTVAHCYLPDGRDLSAEMVSQGLAIDWAKFSGGKYAHLEPPDARRKLYLADARQKGRMHVWEQFEARQAAKKDLGAPPVRR